MNVGTLVLTIVLFILGIAIVFLNPLNPMAISFGMFLVSVAILSVAIQVYFPAVPTRTVELRVVESRARPKPRRKPAKKKAKKRTKTARKAKKTKRKRKR